MSATHYLAVDLGAESGRVMLGRLEDGRLSLDEVHRFANRVQKIEGHQHWDLDHLRREIFAGLEKAAATGTPIAGISADSWGVDYVLIDAEGQPLAAPFCYRDERTAESMSHYFQAVPREDVYAETGIQFMAINTLFQFEAERRFNAAKLEKASQFLLIADYFNEQLSGVKVAEESLASTTQIYNPVAKEWSRQLVGALGLAPSLFPKIVPSGTVLGPVAGELKAKPAFANTKIIATCSHDTGAAVAAVPARGGDTWAYLSSGTWSLIGAELGEPVITDAAREAGFTNEIGLGGKVRFLKNLAGLWVLQECRRAWEAEGQKFDYGMLTQLATDNGPARAHLNLGDARFVSAGEMPRKIADFCRETAQPVPTTTGEYVRLILESLALTYARSLRTLEKLTARRIDTLHIVGGGSQSLLLNQLSADATGCTVITGPVEGTAIGNVLIQALALGQIESPAHLRRIVETSFPTQTYKPQAAFSAETLARFQKLHD